MSRHFFSMKGTCGTLVITRQLSFICQSRNFGMHESSDIDLYPLHTACASGDTSCVKKLLSQGHHVNETNFDLVQPLHEACFNGHIDIVRLLMDAGADVNARNIDGSTPLCDACSSGNEECVRMLLESGANVNPRLLLSSPLHEAVLRDKWRCAEQLITAGANLDQSDCHFGTPLHASVYKGSVNCVKVLLKAGCEVDCVKILSTPLHYAARQQDLTLVSILLEFGADPCKTDNYDLTPKLMVPSATSPVRQLLVDWEKTPRQLRFQCRCIIRRCLGRTRLKNVDDLKLPKFLYDYVTYADL